MSSCDLHLSISDSDVSNLIQAINILELCLIEDIKLSVERDLYRLLSPEVVIGKLAQELLQSDSMTEVCCSFC